MANSDLATIVIAAFLGALGSGLVGWWDSHEPFDWRKFMGTVWRAIFAAMSFAFTNQFVDVKGAIWIWAFLGGAGVDVIGNRLQGGIANKESLDQKIDKLAKMVEDITSVRLPPAGGAPA